MIEKSRFSLLTLFFLRKVSDMRFEPLQTLRSDNFFAKMGDQLTKICGNILNIPYDFCELMAHL